MAGDQPGASEVERAQALAGPRRAGLIALECWLGIATVTALTTSGGSIANGARVGVGVAVAGAAVAVLTSLLAERGLRPAIAVVLAGAPPARDRVSGVQRRLVLFWLLGSGIPLAGILVSPLGHDLADRFVVVGILALAGVGLIAGLSFTVVAARSVAEPLSKVRDAMTSVGDGCLDTELTVDDDGEVGRLQAGFNQMAAGLRERQKTRRPVRAPCRRRRRSPSPRQRRPPRRRTARDHRVLCRHGRLDRARRDQTCDRGRRAAQPLLRDRRPRCGRRGRMGEQVRGRCRALRVRSPGGPN